MQILAIVLTIYILFRLQGLLYHLYWDKNLEAYVNFDREQVSEGEVVVLEEVLENRKWLPIPVIFLSFKMSKHFRVPGERGVLLSDDHFTRNDMLSVMMNQRRRRRVELECTKRGIYKLEQAALTAQSMFLDESYMKEITIDSRIKVYPRYVDARRFMQLIQSVYGSQVMQRFVQEDPFLNRGVREYQVYDSMRRINWNATARTGEMKVNLLEHMASQKAAVYVNVQKESLSVRNEVIEESIRLAKTFCSMFSKRGMKSKLYTNGTAKGQEEAIAVEHAAAGAEYMSRVNEALTYIYLEENGNIVSHGREEELDFVELYGQQIEEDAKDGQVVVISGSQPAGLVELLRRLHKQGAGFLWIVPVDHSAYFQEDYQLKGHMRIWRLNFEGAKEVSA